MKVTDVQAGGAQYLVDRGQCQSTAAAHALNTPVFHLRTRTLVVPFERSFFGTTASGGWTHSEWAPDIRLACADFWTTNTFGQSPITTNNYSQLADRGLRTLRGGQFNFQIEGLLAIKNDAVPNVSVQEKSFHPRHLRRCEGSSGGRGSAASNQSRRRASGHAFHDRWANDKRSPQWRRVARVTGTVRFDPRHPSRGDHVPGS